MKRFIDCYVPVTACNLRCPYCYITQRHLWSNELPKFIYGPEVIAKALSKERLGGVCLLNLCGGGETLLPREMTNIIYSLLAEGHYVWVVTNGTVTQRINELMEFPSEYLSRLGFKFSFHYLELLRTNKIELFFQNISRVRGRCSFSVELTPHDELIPYINDIMQICQKNLGALCHVTVARDSNDSKIPILSSLSFFEYRSVWGRFHSPLFDFKMKTFNHKQTEYCWAGAWSGVLDLGSGDFRPCYRAFYSQNIFNDLSSPIRFIPIGTHCPDPHCYNSHVFLTLGLIPSLSTPTYSSMRNRICIDGTEWLSPNMAAFLSSRLYDENDDFRDWKFPLFRVWLLFTSFWRSVRVFFDHQLRKVQ